jgi:hypothetical protein
LRNYAIVQIARVRQGISPGSRDQFWASVSSSNPQRAGGRLPGIYLPDRVGFGLREWRDRSQIDLGADLDDLVGWHSIAPLFVDRISVEI